ncbi:hypothetical protein Drose_14385 [Dactylosporangium roseum]|uniref:Tetrapyrrole methylase domain-containing protein n=1 Tax=Dactylosporangium roseum TaxID=47989 RepID=A0ABY5ZBT2_9ACTN|nr:SAM-dependent methyltransferase [Dactylosporangium roseum]UWZ39317.1 hypothetical protein Drose_14385 [Dactylosporangium roseum]
MVGLGPGPLDLVSPAVREALGSPALLLTTAAEHPAMSQAGHAVRLDHGALGAEVALAACREDTPVVVAVSGSPYVLEPLVTRLRREHGAAVRVVPNVSFLDLLWDRLGIQPFGGTLLAAPEDVTPATLRSGNLVLAGVTPQWLREATERGYVDPESPVVVARRLGLTGELLRRRRWAELTSDEIDGWTTLFLESAAPPVPASPLGSALAAQTRGAQRGFGLPDLAAAFADVEDELAEARADPSAAEVGDVLFAAVQVARQLGVDPDHALLGAVRRFTSRLDYIDEHAADPAALAPHERRELWRIAKRTRG